MIKAFRHSGIVVEDMALMSKFYKELLDLAVISDEIEEGPFIESVVGLSEARIHVVKMKHMTGYMVELLHYLTPQSDKKAEHLQPSNKAGHSHIALTVIDINEFVNKCKSYKLSPVNPPLLNNNKTVMVCYIHDPEGNLLELVEVI